MATFKAELMDAVQDAVSNFNSGMSDVDAVVKSAESHDFNPKQSERLVESYNTAKTLCVFNKSASDRGAEFDLADKDEVMHRLFSPDEIRKSREKAANADYDLPDMECYSVYSRVPMAELSPAEKTATDNMFGDVPDVYTTERLSEAVVRKELELDGAAAKCAATADMAESSYGFRLDKIAAELSRSEWQHPGLAADAMESIRCELPGSLGDRVVEGVLARMPERMAKKASAPVEWPTCAISRPHILEEAKLAAGEMLAVAEMRKSAADLSAGCDMLDGEYRKAVGLVRPAADGMESMFAPGVLSNGLFFKSAAGADGGKGGGDKPKGKDTTQGVSTMLLSELNSARDLVNPPAAMFSDAVSTFAGAELSKAVGNIVRGPGNREAADMNSRLDNVKRKIILEDLIVNDPIISGADPDTVISAYGTLLRTAPTVSLQKDIVRSMLREMVTTQQAFGPYDAKNLIDLDMGLQKRVRMSRELGKPDTKVDVRI